MWRGGANTIWPPTRHITLIFMKRKTPLCEELCMMVRNLRAWCRLFSCRQPVWKFNISIWRAIRPCVLDLVKMTSVMSRGMETVFFSTETLFSSPLTKTYFKLETLFFRHIFHLFFGFKGFFFFIVFGVSSAIMLFYFTCPFLRCLVAQRQLKHIIFLVKKIFFGVLNALLNAE